MSRIAAEYRSAMARIDDATSVPSQRQRNDMKDDRDNAFALRKSRGWLQGQGRSTG